VVGPSGKLVEKGDFHYPERLNGGIEHVTETGIDPARIFVSRAADQVKVAGEQSHAKDVRLELPEPVEANRRVAVVRGTIHVCDCDAVIGYGGAENSGERMPSTDEESEGEDVRVPSS
jgi:hypothetical protein